MGKYDKTDAAKETGVGTSEASGAWHTARDDAVASGHMNRGSGNTDRWNQSSQAHRDARETFLDVIIDAFKGRNR